MWTFRITRHLFASSSTSLKVQQCQKMSEKKILCMFDVDGTLTAPRIKITDEMKNFILRDVSPKASLALVGGSDFSKIAGQIDSKEAQEVFYSVFSENGLVAHKNGKEVSRMSIQDYVGEEKLQRFINFSLRYMSELTLPVKRGTFIEFRTGLINVCPVGRSCSQAERDQFEVYDRQHQIRKKFVEALRKEFPDLGLVFAIGGQISFDVYPTGWDKTYSLRHIPEGSFDEIHFFGDKTEPGGNDHELFMDKRVVGHKVTGPEDTKSQLKELLQIT